MRGCACIAVFFSKLQHISIDRNIIAYSSLPSAALFSDACISFIVTGLVCAFVRWFHMCPGYLDNEAVYYPARKQMAAFFAMPVFLLPYVLRPSDPLVMTYSVSVLLIDVSLSVTVLYRIYFRWDLVGRTSWRKIFQCFSFSWISAFLLGVVLFPRFCSHYEKWIIGGTAVLSEVSRGNVRKADRFITLYGYYRLVNMFRLEYARLYKLSNPDAIQDLIASESGFTSRVTFYKARKSVGEISEEVSSRVKKLF